MTTNGWIQIAFFSLAVLLVTKPLGVYLVAVYEGRVRWLGPVERLLYRLGGVDPDEDQHWTRYAGATLLFSAASMLLTYAALRLQHLLPLNPQGFPAVPDRQAFETAASFTTNTNWQSYAGESTMSYFSQMSQLAFHNFVSAATGMALAVALVRGIARRSAGRIGNFWADLVRGTLYVLLPICVVLALLMVQQGVIQNFSPYLQVHTHGGGQADHRDGPRREPGGHQAARHQRRRLLQRERRASVRESDAVDQLPVDVRDLRDPRGAHLAARADDAEPAARLGRVGGDGRPLPRRRDGRLLGGGARQSDPRRARRSAGGNMEGKEVRFGIANSALYATVTTDASCGAVNAMHDSFTPLGGLVPLLNIQLGELIFGGVGAGLYGMLVMVVLTVFIAGLMVGRTPEYLGKRIQAREVQVAMLYVLIFPAVILALSALSAVVGPGLKGLNNSGPHGLSEILYAFTSTTGNNGSAFAGLTGSTYYYNSLLGLAMLIGRFAMIVPMVALAGFLSERRIAPATAGTFPVTTPLFVVLLIGVILIVGALTFFPALSLGPIAEHFLMLEGRLF